jgi:hypothetical protein
MGEHDKVNYSPLIDRIRQVFADVLYPGDDSIIGTPEHVEICGECSWVRDSLAGRTWQEVAADDDPRSHLFHAMNFFSPAGFQYYLPAFLLLSVGHGWFTSEYFRPSWNPEFAGYLEEQASRLNADQCGVVVAYLLITLKEKRARGNLEERDVEAVEYWKLLRVKLLARERGAI